MPREIVLVTGGNSGIGFEGARQLARDGWHVLIASRNRQLSAQAVAVINGESGADAASELGLDLGSLQSVRAFVADIEMRNVPLRALVCNAGVQTLARQLSADGYELTFAVNHLGHFLLVNLLLERLVAQAPARIVVVASGVHDPQQWTGMPKATISDWRTLAESGEPGAGAFNGQLAYVNSKLCNMWFTYELNRRIATAGLADKLTVNGFDPGLVPGSGLAREYPAALRMVWDKVLPAVASLLAPVLPGINPAWKAGQALARLVTDPDLATTSGKYFPSTSRWIEAPSSAASYDESRARELWLESERMARLAATDSVLSHG